MVDPNSKLAKWTEPHVILAGLGYVGLFIGAYMSFDGRIADNAREIKANTRLVTDTKERLTRMEDKLDRLIERRPPN